MNHHKATLNIRDLNAMTSPELIDLAKNYKIQQTERLIRQELIFAILDSQAEFKASAHKAAKPNVQGEQRNSSRNKPRGNSRNNNQRNNSRRKKSAPKKEQKGE